jgi:hypothetical protein
MKENDRANIVACADCTDHQGRPVPVQPSLSSLGDPTASPGRRD